MKTFLENLTFAGAIKIVFASVIILMGAVGYYRFFHSEEIGAALWLMIALFVTIELAILYITTEAFSSTLTHGRGISISIAFGITMMWIIATVGIDQTIWGLVEDKYHGVKIEKTRIEADKQREQWLQIEVKKLEQGNSNIQAEIQRVDDLKQKALKLYSKKENRLRDVVWNSGKMCSNADCLTRKKSAENAVELAKTELESHNIVLQTLREKFAHNQNKIMKNQSDIDIIVANRVAFEKMHQVNLDNKHEEALVHEPIMNFFNGLGLNITTPERAYVLLISMVVYPIYMLFIAYLAYNSPKKIAQRKRLEAKQQAKNRKRTNVLIAPLNKIAEMLKKVVIYLIKTRKRKVLVKEIEVEIIKEVEVEKIVYKDGKEVVKVEVEVPHIIEKEVVVEKVVEIPVIEKEFVIVPESIDLNELNKIAKTGSIPKHLKDILEEIRDSKVKFTGVNHDQYRAA